MRTPYVPSTPRRVLCVYPEYARSFGTFQHAYGFFGGRVRAFMPPQGLLAVAAYLPATWEVRVVDENSAPAREDDLRWADVVFVSGMHVQRAQIHDVIARAHAAGRPVALGGPSVSGCPEFYPDADIIHVLEGTATFVTGGTVENAKSTAPGEIRGTAIRNGEERRIAKGDVLIVPAGTPHWFKDVPGPLDYYVVKVR